MFRLSFSLWNTNIIESANKVVCHRSRNVNRRRGGMHVERWAASNLLEKEKPFRRIKQCKHRQLLLATVDQFSEQKAQVAYAESSSRLLGAFRKIN